MDWQANCLAVIPCLNEEKAIGTVVKAVRHYLPTVLVVDDGSSDATAKTAIQEGAIVLKHEQNQGKGAALNDGLRWGLKKGFSWALIMDGDGQHASEDIPAFFSAAERTSVALVVGNRMQNAHAMPYLRRWVNRWMSRRLSQAARKFLPDSQCGFRLINLKDWSTIPVTTSRFEIESEILLRFVRAGLSIAFLPIQVIYKNEKSKIHPLQDTVRWFRWWLREK
jgi:glycosyltransferase involved in cell wall biosynthesis